MIARAKVLLTPLGDKIKFSLVGAVHCSRLKKQLPSSGTFTKDDLVWRRVFGSSLRIAQFLKRNKQITKVLSLYDLGYEEYDEIVAGNSTE